jgi:hypothetical protein
VDLRGNIIHYLQKPQNLGQGVSRVNAGFGFNLHGRAIEIFSVRQNEIRVITRVTICVDYCPLGERVAASLT